MSRIYSNSFFHYTDKEYKLKAILNKGFFGSYSNEQFKDNFGKIYHLYIPMVCFCDIPLNHIMKVTYGGFAIGMNRSWENRNNLSPISYFQKNRDNHFFKYICNIFTSYNNGNGDASDLRKILGYVKPLSKFKEKGYAVNRRKDNYIEKEWRKIYLKNWMSSQQDMDNYDKVHHNKLFTILNLKFHAKDVSFIIVPDDATKTNIINSIQSATDIGGYKTSNINDKLNLISKIITIEEIQKNF